MLVFSKDGFTIKRFGRFCKAPTLLLTEPRLHPQWMREHLRADLTEKLLGGEALLLENLGDGTSEAQAVIHRQVEGGDNDDGNSMVWVSRCSSWMNWKPSIWDG